MAVNDLMMRIQLLVDSGRSSAELNRVQSSLNALTKDLSRLSQIKLNLKDQLSGLADLGSKLKQVNLGNFASSITELEKAFNKLKVPTAQLANLRSAFQSIEVAKAAQATNAYKQSLDQVNQKLKEAKKYTLTNDRQSFNTSLSLQNILLAVNANKVKDVNKEIIKQRGEVRLLNEELKNTPALYAAQRANQGLKSLGTLKNDLSQVESLAKTYSDDLKIAKSNLSDSKKVLSGIKSDYAQLSKQKILEFGVADSDRNATAIRSTIADLQRLNAELEKQKRNLDITKRAGSPNRYTIDQGLLSNEAALRTINKLLDDQTVKTKQLTTKKLLAAQATEQELKAIESLNSKNDFTRGFSIKVQSNTIDKAKSALLDLNNQALRLKATDFSSFAQPIIAATSKVNEAKSSYRQLAIETKRAASVVKTASLVDPVTYKSAINLLKVYRDGTIQSAKALSDHKANLRDVKDQLKLVNQDYRDLGKSLRELRQDAKQLKLPSQQAQLAEYQRLNTELDNLSKNRDLFKLNNVDAQKEKIRQLRNEIKAIGTEQSSVDLFKNANRSLLLIKEQLKNLKVGGAQGTLDFAPLINQFGQLSSGGRSLESISQRMRALRLEIKQTVPDISALKEQLIADKTQVLIGKDTLSDAQKALTDLKIAAKAAKDEVLKQLAPVANQLSTLGQDRISKANLTEGLLNEVSRLKKALNDIQPVGLEGIRKETDKLNASLTALRFGNEQGLIPIGQIGEGKKSIASLKQEIESLKVSARSIKLDNQFFTNADAPNLADLFKKSGLDKLISDNQKLKSVLDSGIGSWKEYATTVQSWTSQLREGQARVGDLRSQVDSLKNVGENSLRALSKSIRDSRLEMQNVGTVNFNQVFRDEGVVNLLDKMNAVKQSIVDINKISAGQQSLGLLNLPSGAVEIPIKLKGLTEIQNQIRTLASEKGLEKALNVGTVSASAKAIKSEIDVLKELKKSYKEALKTNELSAAEITAHENRIKFLNDQLIAQGKIGSAYKGTLAIEQKIIELEGKNVALKLQSADSSKKIADNQSLAIAKLKEQETIGKNNLNTLSQQAKEINQIVAAERNRAKLAKESERTNLLRLTGKLNETKTSIDGLSKQIADQQTLNSAYRLSLSLLNDFGKGVKTAAGLAYNESKKAISSKLEELGLLKSTESSYLRQLSAQRDSEKAAKSTAQTAKDAARLTLNAAQLEYETNQNAIRGSRERASALRDISSAIRANATVASLSNAESIRYGESALAQLKRQYQQYVANVAATRSEMEAKRAYSKAGLSGLYEELAVLQKQRVSLLEVASILKGRGVDIELQKKIETARLSGLREEAQIRKQIAEIKLSEDKSNLAGLADRVKSAKTAVDALVLSGKELAKGLTLSDVTGSNEVLKQRVALSDQLRTLSQKTLGLENQLNQSRSVRDTQGSVVKDLEAQVKATKAIAVANLEAAKTRELNAQSSLVTARKNLDLANDELAKAKSLNEQRLAGLTVRIAENNVAVATAKQNVSALENTIAEREKELTLIREGQAARVLSVAQEIKSLEIEKARNAEQKALLTARKNELTNELAQENAQRKQSITLIQQQIDGLVQQRTAASSALNTLITDSRKANLESQRNAQADIVSKETALNQLKRSIEANNLDIASKKEAIKGYQEALKAEEDRVRAAIKSANERIASGQLTKSQLAEERNGIRELIKEQQNLSKAYVGRLTEQANSLKASLNGEKDSIRLLEQRAKAETDSIQKQVLMNAALTARNELTKYGGQAQSLSQQIQETENLAKAEMNRLAILERLGNSAQKQNFGVAIKETQRIIDETTKRLSDLAVKSEAAKVKLGQIGTGSDLPTLNTQIKQTISDLKSLKQAGLTGTQPYSDIERQLSNLREQRALLRQIASIDIKTASGQVELKGLQQTINQLREAQREMSKLQQFARGFGQGFTFALQPDQLGMAAFNTLQQVLSELGRSFIQVNKETETLTRGLTAVFGAGQGEVQFEKLVGLANTYGLALHDLSRNYLSLNASSKGTILEGQESEKIFRSLSAAMAVLGADTITTQRAFRAVSQMISKGQVYAEELKGQLAEALPGAIQIFARSMGKTSQEFLAMAKAGNVGLTELIPFFQQVEQEYVKAATASTTYEQATNRLSNAFSILLKNAGDTGAWKAIIAIVNEAGAAVNIVANNMGTIAQNVNAIFARLKTMGVGLRSNQEVSLDTKKAETNVDSLSNKLRVFDAYLKSPSSFILPLFTGVANEGLAQLEQSVKDFKLSTIQDLSQVTAMSEEMFNKIKSSPESFDAILPAGTYQDYLKYIDEVNQKIKEENRLRAEKRANYQADVASIYMETQSYKDKLAAFKASTEARGGYGLNEVGIDEKKLALTKQQINATKSLLNTQQQGQTALYAVESQRAALSLKSSGSSAAIIAEAKSALSLKNAYTELAKAKQIEANIKTGSKDKKEDSTPDQIKLIRELTVDQLKYALTVARTANNYSLTLAILQELSRVQTEIATEPAINPLAGFKTASYDTVQGLEKIIERLKEVTKEGSKAAGQIYKMLALVEQQNKINTLKTTGKYKYELDDLKREIEYNEKNVKANDKVSEKKREAIVLGNASLALAKAEEIFGKMKRTNNDAELAQLREVYAEYVNISKAQASSASDKKAKPIFEQLQALEEQFSKFQKKADATNLNAMEESSRQLADSLGNVKDASGNLDFTAAFGTLESNLKVASDEFVKLKIQLASMKETDPDFGVTKAAMEEAARKANGLRTELENVRTTYQGLASTGQVPTIEFKPVLSSDIDNEIQKYRNDLLGKDASVSIDVDDSKAKGKVSALIADINSRSATINVNVVYSESGNKPKGYHSGGLLAGYGGGDRIHALLEPGEFVFRKEAVRAIGLGQLMKMNRVGQNIAIQRNSSINQLNIPKFASGGMVGGSPITINVPGSRPIQMVGSRESAMALANLLTRTSRSL